MFTYILCFLLNIFIYVSLNVKKKIAPVPYEIAQKPYEIHEIALKLKHLKTYLKYSFTGWARSDTEMWHGCSQSHRGQSIFIIVTYQQLSAKVWSCHSFNVVTRKFKLLLWWSIEKLAKLWFGWFRFCPVILFKTSKLRNR